MRVNLTPEEVTVKIEDATFVFHKIHNLTATELKLAFQDIRKSPKILVQKLMAYCKHIDGLQGADGKPIEAKDFDRLPTPLLHELYTTFLKEAALQSSKPLDDMEAEEKNSEKASSEDSDSA